MGKTRLRLINEVQQKIDIEVARLPNNLPQPYKDQLDEINKACMRIQDLIYIQEVQE